MARLMGNGSIMVGIISLASVYMGMKFFQPIVVEQLRRDGHLRDDIYVPEFDKEGNIILPKDQLPPTGDFILKEEARESNSQNKDN